MRTIEEIAKLLEQNGYSPKEIGLPCFCEDNINRVECWVKSLNKAIETCNAERDRRLKVEEGVSEALSKAALYHDF